jgi:hypothetical protein
MSNTKAFIHIDLSTDNPTHFENPILSELKSFIQNIETFDLDAGSESLLFSYAGELVKRADKSMIVVKVNPDSSFRKIQGIADILIKSKEKVMVLLDGDNQLIRKLFNPIGKNFLNFSPEKFQSNVEYFFKDGQ